MAALCSCATQLPPSVSTFTIQPATIDSGATVTLQWNVAHTEGRSVEIAPLGNVAPGGDTTLQPDKSQTYNLSVRSADGTVLASRSATVTVRKPQPPPPPPPLPPPPPAPKRIIQKDSVSKGEDDGRFTIGAGATRMMYGYPIPHSTSHFVLRVNDKYITNNPSLASSPRVRYVSGKYTQFSSEGSTAWSVEYHADGLTVIQTLRPVDKDFRDISSGYGHHYRVSYSLKNETDEAIDAGIMVLFDTMIDDNDACRIQADGRMVNTEQRWDGSSVPKSITAYRKGVDKGDFYSEFSLAAGKATPPDAVMVGNWPAFHSSAEAPRITPIPYFDSAVMMLWNPTAIQPGDTRTVATHYGLPKGGEINAKKHTETETISLVFTMASGSTTISGADKKALREAIAKGKVEGALVSGYSDAPGSDNQNMTISRRRAESAKKAMQALGIPSANIITKGYGETFADQSRTAQKRGNKADRKVIVNILIAK